MNLHHLCRLEDVSAISATHVPQFGVFLACCICIIFVVSHCLIISGEVILDKLPAIRTVVNKTRTIDNTYRNFQMELLAGESDFITIAREHGCAYKLDFAKVYWNSRLGMLMLVAASCHIFHVNVYF